MLKLLSSAEVEKLGPYELVGQLASGGMATVFLARRAGLGGFSRYVAIKRLRPELSKSSAFLAMLIDEARLAARIHHPNVAATIEFSDAGDDDFYLVMEYVEGGSLLDLVTRSAAKSEVLPPKVVVRIALDALAGLHAAHELHDDEGKSIDLVHRDLSPHNLMVGLDGCTRVVDFGLARAASRLTKTAVGTLKGKLAYMAPEQLHQRPIDRRADLFSVGVVLWEGLCGERLFRAETDVGTIERVLRGEIPSLRTALPWLSPALDRVALKALARDPDARYQTAEEMSLALSEAAEEVNLVGSPREVGACVARLLGDELANRREVLRGWIDAHEPAEPPSQTQLCFAGLAAQTAWTEDPAFDATPDTEVYAALSKEPPPEDDRVAAVQGSVIGAPSGMSIAPISSPAPKRRPTKKRRSLAPLFAGAIIGLGAIGLALFARAGHLPLLRGTIASPAAPLEQTHVDRSRAEVPAEPSPVVANRETDDAEADAPDPLAVADPAGADVPAPDREESQGTVDAEPVKSAPARRYGRPYAAPRRPSRRAPEKADAPAPSEPPAKGDKPAGKQRDLDNPYR